MSETGWKRQAGKDADLFNHSKRRGNVELRLREIRDFVQQYIPQTGLFGRNHLSRLAREWLEQLSIYRFSFNTYEQNWPILSYWVKELQTTRKHLIRLWHALVAEGLLVLPEGHKRGKRLKFTAEALFAKVREWLGLPQPVEEAEQEAGPALEGEKQPIPFPVPEPQPEPEPMPVPEAAMVAAPEWSTIKAAALTRMPKGAHHWLNGAQAYRIEESFVIVVQTHSQGRQLSTRFHDLLMSLIEKYCVWCQFVRYDVAARSAG